MHLSRIGRRPARLVAVLAALVTLIGLLTYTRQVATAKPPPNPSDSQLQGAKNNKEALASLVGKLSGEIASMTQQLQQLEAKQEMAEQKLAYAVSLLREAKTEAHTARVKVHRAKAQVRSAQHEFVAYLQASYMDSGVDGTTGALLTARNPSVLLEQGAMRQYQSDHQISAIGRLQRATVAKSNADAAARRAVLKRQKATTAAKIAKHNADAAVAAAQQQKAQLEQQKSQKQSALQQAQHRLAVLTHQRAAYVAYQKRMARIRAEKARQERIRKERARKAHEAYLKRLARERAQERANARDSSHSGSSGGGGGGGGGASYVSSPAPSPSGGGWSAARGRAAVARARTMLGVPYSWAGGNASGPTYGVCDVGTGGWNDCHVRGMDCSGLTLYAWAPYTSMAHWTVRQYSEAGSYHPSQGNLMPGDLVFWSHNGTVGGIHHVAIYIGHGDVIQAPFSGSYVQVTPLDQVSSGYFGATRPLT